MIKQSPLWCADEYVWYIYDVDSTYFSTKIKFFKITVYMCNYCVGITQVLECKYKNIRDEGPFSGTYERIE